MWWYHLCSLRQDGGLFQRLRAYPDRSSSSLYASKGSSVCAPSMLQGSPVMADCWRKADYSIVDEVYMPLIN